MEKNPKLLRDAMEHILLQPKSHDQNACIQVQKDEETGGYCGTTMCLAGHAAALSGAQVPKDTLSWRVDPVTGELSPIEHDVTWGDRRTEGMLIEDWAREKLGMTSREAEFIFYCMDNESLAGRVEHLIQLWENGEEFDYYNVDEHVYDCCEYCG